MIESITYTEPTLCHYNYDLTKPWFVYFDITNHGNGQTIRKQFRGGINFWKTKDDRVREANARIKYWKSQIQSGWHPFEQSSSPLQKRMTFSEALDFGLSKCHLASKTMAGYRGTVSFVKKAAAALSLSKLQVRDVKRVHIKLILEKCVEQNGWSNKSYNKYLGYLKAILSRVQAWEIIETNPAHKISFLPVAETEKYIPYTEAEKKAITECLFINHYCFYVLVVVVHDTGIRPKEVLALKIKDLDFINQQITIVPDLDRENSKTKKIRKVPISKALMPFLRELRLNEYSRECYVFGSANEPGKGNCGSCVGGARGALHPDYFKPSFVKIKRDTVTKLWKKLIIDGLGISKYLYAAKHTGANAKILAGIDLDTLQELYGHSSKLMTERYATEIKKVRFNEIIEKSPGF